MYNQQGYTPLRRKRRREVFRERKMDVTRLTCYAFLFHTLLCMTRIRSFDICPQRTKPKMQNYAKMDRKSRPLVMRATTSNTNKNGRTWPERQNLPISTQKSSTAGVRQLSTTTTDHSSTSRYYNSIGFPSSSNTSSDIAVAATTTRQYTRQSQQPSSPSRPVLQRRRQRRQKMKPMPILGYSARTILAYYDARPLEVGWRLNSLLFPLLGM